MKHSSIKETIPIDLDQVPIFPKFLQTILDFPWLLSTLLLRKGSLMRIFGGIKTNQQQISTETERRINPRINKESYNLKQILHRNENHPNKTSMANHQNLKETEQGFRHCTCYRTAAMQPLEITTTLQNNGVWRELTTTLQSPGRQWRSSGYLSANTWAPKTHGPGQIIICQKTVHFGLGICISISSIWVE